MRLPLYLCMLTICVAGFESSSILAQDKEAPAQEKKEETKKEETKKEDVKKEEPKKEETKKEDTKKEEPKKEDTKKEETKKEEPKKEDTKKEDTKKEEPKKEDTKKEETKKEDTKKEEPKKEDTKKEEKKEEVQAFPIITNFESPTGIAIHEGTGHVFIASRYGVYRYDPAKHALSIEIAGYPKEAVYGKGPKYNIGPLGVAFLDKDHLVVADGSRDDGKEVMRVYKVGGELLPPKKWQKEAEGAVQTIGPIAAGDQSVKGEGNFYAIAVTKDAVYTTCNGDDSKGWVARAVRKDGKLEKLEPWLATKEKTEVDAPVGITTSPDGKSLVIGQSGEVNVAGDSLLTIYDEKGELVKKYETGLHDLIGLAYSPKTGKLYGVDFAWVDAKQGGLYRLDIEGDKCTPTKILALDKPAALAFDKNGALYLTIFGTKADGSKVDPGSLLRIAPGL